MSNELPAFVYQGVVLDYANLAYRPHDDLVFPSVIKAYELFAKPLGRYYMYYGPHDAPGGICLAYADRLEGPWTEYTHNPVIGKDWPPHYSVSHVCSPDAIWNRQVNKLFLYFHGENSHTRFATSDDGIHFDYGDVAVWTDMIGPGLTEASYARVAHCEIPGLGPRYVMNLMVNSEESYRRNPIGIRTIHLAFSPDGRTWTPMPRPFIEPPPRTDQTGSAWYLPWRGRHYAIVIGNLTGTGFDPVSNLYAYEIDAAWTRAEYRGCLLDHSVVSAENRRVDSCCIVREAGRLYMFLSQGKRLNQKIGLAIADAAE